MLQVLPMTGRFVAVSREERFKELGHEILDFDTADEQNRGLDRL